LDFIQNKKAGGGIPIRFSFLEIRQQNFILIPSKMLKIDK